MKLSLIISNEEAEGPRLPGCVSRRIWEVDPTILALVTGVLLRREDIESILHGIGHDCEGVREDALRVRLLVGCSTPCALAEAVERVLDRQTQEFREAVERPMMQVADWWSRERDGMSGARVAALLWRLSGDGRSHLDRLVSRVSGDLCVRAMQLLRQDPGVCLGQTDDARLPEASPIATGCKRTASAPYEVNPAAVA